jgi:hypothetical protein
LQTAAILRGSSSAAWRAEAGMANEPLHPDLQGWWRITGTSQWVNEGLDDSARRCSRSPGTTTASGCIACSRA